MLKRSEQLAKTQKRARAGAKTRRKSTVSPLMIGIVVIGAILVVGGLILLGNQSGTGTGAPIDISQFPALGEVNAPVTMVEFSDYGCPHCRDFALEKFPLLKTDYIDTGKVRYIVHSFNLGNPQTALAAEAAWCARDQDRFFEYHHALFENQGQIALNQSSLIDLAASLGLDRNTFSNCLANRTHQTEVENARQAAARRGVDSTPTFLINNRPVEGNQPYDVFQRIIDQALASTQ